jgi:hypothetical protein
MRDRRTPRSRFLRYRRWLSAGINGSQPATYDLNVCQGTPTELDLRLKSGQIPSAAGGKIKRLTFLVKPAKKGPRLNSFIFLNQTKQYY